MRNLTFSRHTHEYSKTQLIYYHTLTIQFAKSVTGNAYLNVQLEIGYPLPSTYPDELKDNTFFVLYGVKEAYSGTLSRRDFCWLQAI